MDNYKKGFTPIVIIVVVLFTISGIFYFYRAEKKGDSDALNNSGSPAETSQDQPVSGSKTASDGNVSSGDESLKFDIRGNWEFVSTVGGKPEINEIVLFYGEENKGEYTSGRMQGSYAIEGGKVKIIPGGGAEYVGIFMNGEAMGGDKMYSGAKFGTWEAKRRADINMDIRGDWKITTMVPALKSPTWQETMTIGVETPIKASMTKGKLSMSSQPGYKFDYNVSWPVVEWDYFNSAKYFGKIMSVDLIKGDYIMYALGAEPSGTFIAERIKK